MPTLHQISDLRSCDSIAFVAAQSGSGSPEPGCFFGPEEFYEKLFQEHPSLSALPIDQICENPTGSRMEALPGLTEFNTQLAAVTFSIKSQNQFPFVVGGDHSCAIGTWSGVSAALGEKIGLLWIDAHMDSHTPESTESGAIHGMPLASLLGYGTAELTGIGGKNAKVDSERLVLFGVRSFEAPEAALLERLGVRVYLIDEIAKRGFEVCWQEALLRVRGDEGQHFGVTLDLDALDPLECPGVGSPVDFGLSSTAVIEAMSKLRSISGFTGFEVVEYNPEFEEDRKSYEILLDLCLSLVRMPGFQENYRVKKANTPRHSQVSSDL